MASEDYYKTLGVAREASDDEIRKAYKKLARKYHPDTRPNDKDAAEKFKKIQEAYGVLGDSEKREQYDRYGAAFEGARRAPFTHTWSSRPGAGPIDIGDLFGGQIDLGDLFGAGAGRGGAGRGFGRGPGAADRGPSAAQKGQDLLLEITIPFQIAVDGGSHPIQLRRGEKTERLTIKIPAGIDEGAVIRLAGQGQTIGEGIPPGDLRLTIRVAAHSYFRREGSSLLLDVPVTPSEAVLGAKIEVPTLSEGKVTVTVPPGTSSGTRLRLRGKGVAKKNGARGDQFVVIKIVVPKSPSENVQTLYRQLQDAEKQSPRTGLW